MTSISEKINAFSTSIEDEFPHRVLRKVSEALNNVLMEKDVAKLASADVLALGRSLVIGHEYSYDTWLHRKCLNWYLFELNNSKDIESPFFNNPVQIRRNLLVNIDKAAQDDIKYIQILHDDLLSLKTSKYETLENEGTDYICSFIASAAIFAKILFPGFHEKLLKIRLKELSFDPAFINLYYEGGGDAFYRHFLPSPSSLYLFRCILFFNKNRSKFGFERLSSPDDQLFPSQYSDQKNFSSTFKAWTERRLKAHGVDNAKGLSLRSFCSAALTASVMEPMGGGSSYYPPFVLAVQSRQKIGSVEINSHSYNSSYLPMLLGSQNFGMDFIEDGHKAHERSNSPISNSLKQIIDELTKIRRALMKKTPCSAKDRVSASEEIRELATAKAEQLPPDEYENLRLYTEWICDMLHHSKLTVSSINTYASEVPTLLYQLHGEGVITKLPPEKLKEILSSAIGTYRSRGGRKAFKLFTDFLSSYVGDEFNSPGWGKSKELRSENIISQRPLIDFSQMSQAVQICEAFFTDYLKEKKVRSKGLAEAEKFVATHKAIIIGHMIGLGFYAGVRVSEFVNLKTSNVIYDEGWVLCIRTSKTRNGIRNIPLSLLLPDAYMKDFVSYYKESKARNGINAFLFPQFDGKIWDKSHVSKEVSRLFESFDVEMRFHDLRHSFANWFILRWFVTFHRDKIPEDLPFLKEELFQQLYLDRVRDLMLGMSADREGQKSFTYVLAVLARLIGHGGPVVTLNSYFHTGDFLFYLLSKASGEKKIAITSQQAESYLQVSYPSLPEKFKGRGKKEITMKELQESQVLPLYEKLSKRLKKVNAEAEGLRNLKSMKASLK